jgi:hypothetical protein
VANTVGTIVGSATEFSVNPNASAEVGTKKFEDELPDDGCAEGFPMNPKVEGKKAQQYVIGQLQTLVKEKRMIMDHGSALKTFVNEVLEKGWGKTTGKYGFASVKNTTLYFNENLGKEQEGGGHHTIITFMQ